MTTLLRRLMQRLASEEAQALAEYSLIIAFVAIVCIAAVTALGLAILGPFTDVLAGF